jgi:hypothetical protein
LLALPPGRDSWKWGPGPATVTLYTLENEPFHRVDEKALAARQDAALRL